MQQAAHFCGEHVAAYWLPVSWTLSFQS